MNEMENELYLKQLCIYIQIQKIPSSISSVFFIHLLSTEWVPIGSNHKSKYNEKNNVVFIPSEKYYWIS
jgi:hypothetical protein